ncbi:YjgN family protein [Undibacterium sp. Ren11W]|uniref:YjgN family protein n=1 Tax=Undibacterium sp. Ren11W TaxID=3413045 RepID=UPI003BF15AF3
MDLTHQASTALPVFDSASPVSLEFKGSGSEYFRIWIVNLLLSILTLGIYSAWAKVRRNRYFYSNTSLAGSSFEYHGNAIAILKGRIVALVFVLAYQLAFKHSLTLGLLMMAILASVMPWLVWKSLQFKLYNSSYRGIRFGFRGDAAQAYVTYLLWPLLALFSMYLLAPFMHQRIKRFQHNESRFGATHFSFDGKVKSFYWCYLVGFGIMLAGLVVISLVFGGAAFAALSAIRKGHIGSAIIFPIIGFFLALYLWMFAVYPIFLTLLQNLIWNHTKLGEHQFSSHLKWGRMTSIMLTNILGIVCTLGLFIPFAQVRALRYRVENLSLQMNGSLDHFIAVTEEQVSATGEGMADLLDFDISL